MDEPQGGGRCRIGYLGCGRATTELHLPALGRVPEIEVVAVCDADAQRARDAAARFGIPHVHHDIAALLARDDLDAVAVCVPPQAHADAAIAVLDSGRHLFVEKPLALSLDDCDRIIECAAHARGAAVVGFNLRQHRLVREARARIGAGELGRIDLIRSTFTSDIALRRALPQWRLDGASGGGVLFELAVHHFDLWRFLTGAEFADVRVRTLRDAGRDIAATVTAVAANGIIATAQFSERTHAANELEILGERGRLRLSLYDFDGLRFFPVHEPPGGIGSKIRASRHALSQLSAAFAAARHGGDWVRTFEDEWHGFVRTIRGGEAPGATLHDGRAAVVLALEATEHGRHRE